MPSEALTDLTRADLFHKIDGAIAEFKNIEKRLDKRMNKIDDAHKGDHDILVGLQVSLEGIIEILKRHDAKLDNLNDVNAKLAQHGLHEGTQDGNRLWMAFGRIMLNWRPVAIIITGIIGIITYLAKTGGLE